MRGSSTSPTRSASLPERCSTPGTALSASATSRSGSNASSPRCSTSRRKQSSSIRSDSTISPGFAPFASRGVDVLPTLLSEQGERLASEVDLPLQLLQELGAIPSYYLRYFYAHDVVLGEQLAGTPRAAAVADIERDLLEIYRDPSVDEKPALLEQRGGAFYSEAATGLVAALVSGSSDVHEVDIRNDGVLGGLADDDVVEVPATIVGGVPVPLPQRPLAPELLGLTQHVAAYERLALAAALSGDPVDVRRALLAHPLVGQWITTDDLVARLLAVEAGRLPEFVASRGVTA